MMKKSLILSCIIALNHLSDWFSCSQNFKIVRLSNLSILSVPASSLKQQIAVQTCCYKRTPFPDSEIPSLCSYSLMLQSVPITTEVVSQNPVHGEVYLIQHYVIKFVSYLRQVGGFLLVHWFPLPIKLTATIELKYC